MTPETFNTFCQSLTATTHVVQWGGADVWKVGGKVFAIGGEIDGGFYAFRFKTSEMTFEALRDHPDCRPAPYLASRGLKWIQIWRQESIEDAEIKDLIRASYDMIAAALPKKTQKALGLT